MIGSQVWMAENLRTTKYRNGTSITNITTDNTQWLNNTAGAYCNYKNILTNDCPYGKLYNWYAVSNSNQLCPNGWHVPSDSEWTTLTNFLGGETVAGVKAKSAGTQFWLAPNTDATNDSGLSALPGGYRGNAGAFAYEGYYGYWWSASENLAEGAFSRRLDYNNTILKRENYVKATGFSVRCVKD
jgi:uncharacterized protein (TIGR02145 family)